MRRSGRVRVPAKSSKGALRELLNYVVTDPLLQAATIRRAFAHPRQWLDALAVSLRPPSPKQLLDGDKPLMKIADLVAVQYLSNRRRHIPVLTFNYDDLIETVLRSRLGKYAALVHSVSSADAFARSIHRAGVFVYHLHGAVTDPDSVVLDAASYVNVLAAPGRHWSWEAMNYFLLHGPGTAALFLGLSLLDPSLRLLLTQAAAKGMSLSGVYVSKPFPRFKRGSLSTMHDLAVAARDLETLFDEVLLDLSLTPYHVSSWDEVTTLLMRIARK